ncbi:MAG TPA: hypothetical protein VEW26_04410 [Allosphingosinicella sp.]|nr:hypothetical protein [Allosphingosinicella sp.]
MTSATSIPAADERETGEKDVWVEPAVTRFDVGDAEASDGPGPDGGLAS